MIKRSKSEENVYQILLECGVPAENITEPDKIDGYSEKAPDFIIAEIKLAIEVKHFVDKDLLNKDREQLEKFKKGEIASWAAPVKNHQFGKHLSDASKKFRNYPDYSTLLVEDLSDIYFLRPDIEFLVCGMLTMHISKETGEVMKWTNKERKLRIDRYTEIGALCFLERNQKSIYHNLMADKNRIAPYYFWAKKLEKVDFEQFTFFCPPGELSQISKLESTK